VDGGRRAWLPGTERPRIEGAGYSSTREGSTSWRQPRGRGPDAARRRTRGERGGGRGANAAEDGVNAAEDGANAVANAANAARVSTHAVGSWSTAMAAG
jgi:hypothetical protein